jgi:hypothetical protein
MDNKDFRQFKRIKTDMKIGIDIVNWSEIRLDALHKPVFALVHDISPKGIGLTKIPEIDEDILKDLKNEKKKIRLGIFINKDKDPILVFAKLVWSKKNALNDIHFGLLFLDVQKPVYDKIKAFFDKQLNK